MRLFVVVLVAAMAYLPAAARAQQCSGDSHTLVDLGGTAQLHFWACFPGERGLGHWNLFLGVRNETSHRLVVQFEYDVTLATGRVDTRRAYLSLRPGELRGGGNFTGDLDLSAHYEAREERPRSVRIRGLQIRDLDAEEEAQERDRALLEEQRAREEAGAREADERRQREAEQSAARRRREEEAAAERERRDEETRTRAQARQAELERQEAERREREEEARRAAEEEERREVEEEEERRESRLAAQAERDESMQALGTALLGMPGSDSEYRGLSFRIRLGIGGGWSMFPVATNSSGGTPDSGTSFAMGIGPTLDIEAWPLFSSLLALSVFGSGNVDGVSTGEASAYLMEGRVGGRALVGTPWIAFVAEYMHLFRIGGYESSSHIAGTTFRTSGSGDYRMERAGGGLRVCFSVSDRQLCEVGLGLLAFTQTTDIERAAQRSGWAFAIELEAVQAVRVRAELGVGVPAPGTVRWAVDDFPQDVTFQIRATRSWDFFGDSYLSASRADP